MNLYDYGARCYDPRLCSWTTQDPLADKYYGVSSYVYCSNSPIVYVDPNGKKIQVAEKYREQFMNDIRAIYGDKANFFSFSDDGFLQLNIKKSDFIKGISTDQIKVFKGLNKAITDKVNTSIVYEDNYELSKHGEKVDVNIIKEYGGGLYSEDEKIIVVAPNARQIDVIAVEKDFKLSTQKVLQNTTTVLFHEIGERNIKNTEYRGSVIDFENSARKVLGFLSRPYDLDHSYSVGSQIVDFNKMGF